jgi:SAM-dependent methyltransferase
VTIAVPDLLRRLECPTCRNGQLVADGAEFSCAACGDVFGVDAGVLCCQRTFDDYSENYDQIASDDLLEPKTPPIVKEIFAQLVVERARGVVCDLGCGDGYVIRRVESPHRIAVDIARAYLDRLPADILRIWSRVERVPVAAGSVDTVICTDVLEHVVDALPVARELDRLCAPDGRLLLAFPFEQDLSVYELPEYKAKYGKYKFVHLRSITDDTVATLFPSWDVLDEHLIEEGMPLMEFKPFPIKFVELGRRG